MLILFLNYVIIYKKKGIILPAWLIKAKNTGAPWISRDEFLKDKKRVDDLRQLLLTTIDLQTSFIIEQFEEQWPKILKACPNCYKNKIIYYNLFKYAQFFCVIIFLIDLVPK